jgi:hypothetical protein
MTDQQEIVRRVDGLFAPANQIEAQMRAAQCLVDTLTPLLPASHRHDRTRLARDFRGQLVPKTQMTNQRQY